MQTACAVQSQQISEITRLARSAVGRVLSRRGFGQATPDVEDLTQHVLAHLYAEDGRALHTWDPSYDVSFPGYVCLLARRSAISALRQRRHHPRDEWLADPVTLDARSGEGPTQEERWLEQDRCRRLLTRLEAELSPLGRRVLHALYAQDLSIEDASRTLGLTPDALYAWRARIRQHALRLSEQF